MQSVAAFNEKLYIRFTKNLFAIFLLLIKKQAIELSK